MFIDSSRIKDLDLLRRWMNDFTHSTARRQMYLRTYKKILSQLHDPKLASMRERLMLATKAGDKYEMWKITNQIKDYSKEELVTQQYK